MLPNVIFHQKPIWPQAHRRINNKAMKKNIAIIIIISAFAFAAQVGAGKVVLNPIKPGAKQKVALTDEQQAILAVRSAKPSVVSIIGNRSTKINNKNQTVYSSISGSGIIYSKDGLIVSNNHVVSDEDAKYYVVFADGTQSEAKILGLDKYNDVALLKIQATNLPAASFGNSDALETGQSIFAIGNSLGKYQNTVTRGVVSGLGRAVGVGEDEASQPRLQNLIQTDAAINPGNSGGPVINLSGEVVGMSTLIDRSGEGVGFAVPVNTIKDSVDQLQKYGKVSRSYLGVAFTDLSRTVASMNSLSVYEGAWIRSVAAGSPAYLAGILVDDIVTEINKEKITSVNELDKILSKYSAGTQVLFSVLRGSEKKDILVILGEYK